MITTKYGNKYTEAEWAEMMSNWDTEIAQAQDALEQMDRITEAGLDMLYATEQFNNVERPKLRAALNRNWNVQFSSIEKQQAAEPIFDWFNEKMNQVR